MFEDGVKFKLCFASETKFYFHVKGALFADNSKFEFHVKEVLFTNSAKKSFMLKGHNLPVRQNFNFIGTFLPLSSVKKNAPKRTIILSLDLLVPIFSFQDTYSVRALGVT